MQQGYGEAELQKAGVANPRAYARATAAIHVPGLHVHLVEAHLSQLLELRLEQLDAAARYRPVHGGLGLTVSVGGFMGRDASTPWPQLRTIARAGRPSLAPPPAEVRETFGGGFVRGQDGEWRPEERPVPSTTSEEAAGSASRPFLQLALELEPVDSDDVRCSPPTLLASPPAACLPSHAADSPSPLPTSPRRCQVLVVRGEVERAGLLLNPTWLAALGKFASVPPSHWQAANELGTVTTWSSSSARALGVLSSTSLSL